MKAGNRKSVGSEIDIQNSICDYLSLKHYFFWRQNTIAPFREGRWFSQPRYSMNGIPDIILIKNGKFIGLEVKKPKGKQSDNQKIFEERCKKAGGEYYIVTDLKDIEAIGL